MTKIGVLLLVMGGFPYLVLNMYLSLKLRKRKYEIIHAIVSNAPPSFRERAKFLMESNISWIFASSAGHTWYSYLLLRFGWQIPKQEIQAWHIAIKSIYGSDYMTYKISTLLINVWLTGLPVLILLAFKV